MKKISYLSECLKKDRLIRWADNCMPLTVYIATFRWYKSAHESYTYNQMIIDALELWSKASEGALSFRIVQNLNQSQINIEWKRVERSALGKCQYSFDTLGRLYSAEITIGLSDGLIHAQYQDKNEVFHTILHEIGHALGLDHSPNIDDIMFVPHQYGVIKLSEKDKKTLKWLYHFPYGYSSQEIISRYKLQGVSDLDKLIYRLEINNLEEAPQPVNQNNSNDALRNEQKILADLNKYNLSLQNISLSPELQDFVRRTKIEQDKKSN